MCMEDVRLGRKEMPQEHFITVTTSSQQLLPPAPDRAALMISSALAGNLTLSINQGVVSGSGINRGAGTAPLILNVKDHGQLVTSGWWGIMDAGTEVIACYETMLGER